MSFFIAMQNRRATASYSHPQTIISERNEFLIVTRSGGRNEFLSVSSAGASMGTETEAPEELKPGLMILATLVSQGPNLSEEIFVVERELPRGVEVPGGHVGGDGYLVLRESPDDLRLWGSVRLRPGEGTREAAQGCPLLGPEEEGCTLHLDAGYLPWNRELLPGAFRGASGRLGAGRA